MYASPHRERLAGFVESEAELSGEDVEGDEEEEEEGERESEYEEDGEQSDVPQSESELWGQINKILQGSHVHVHVRTYNVLHGPWPCMYMYI